MNRKSGNRLNIQKVLTDFEKAEKSTAHRKGSFKIEGPFEKALETILKPKNDLKRTKKGNNI